MGLLAATITQQQLTGYKCDLEYKIMLINQAKLGLISSQDELVTAGSDMDPDSPELKTLEARKEKLNQLEKKLDMQLAEYQMQLNTANQNLKTAGEIIKSSTGGGQG